MIETVKKIFSDNKNEAKVETTPEVVATPLSVSVLDALGGLKNIIEADACATRLRLEIKDTSLVKEDELKALGSAGVTKIGENGVHVIFAAKAKEICKYINFIKNENDLVDALAVDVLVALGGPKNIKEADACATRLRLQVNDPAAVNEEELKALGSAGVTKVGEHGVQVIFGAKAKQICKYISGILGE